jgi:ubiquitin carboxyl-terminal hydrolase 44/49
MKSFGLGAFAYCFEGDPLGPLLFAIVLHDLILKIATECPGLDINLWYLDDGSLMGDAADLYKAWTIISVYGRDFGLYVNVPKCVLFWPNNLQRFSNFSIFPNEPIRTNVGIEV